MRGILGGIPVVLFALVAGWLIGVFLSLVTGSQAAWLAAVTIFPLLVGIVWVRNRRPRWQIVTLVLTAFAGSVGLIAIVLATSD